MASLDDQIQSMEFHDKQDIAKSCENTESAFVMNMIVWISNVT